LHQAYIIISIATSTIKPEIITKNVEATNQVARRFVSWSLILSVVYQQ